MLLKNNLLKNIYRIPENWTLYDLLKGPSLRSQTFVEGLIGSGMQPLETLLIIPPIAILKTNRLSITVF